jgi:NitT/TauT family transport system ATP-binding protein
MVKASPASASPLVRPVPGVSTEPDLPAEQGADVLLRAERVSVTYRSRSGSVAALAPTSFSVARGEFICIVGPSGCGKTTLLNCIAGLLKFNGSLSLGGVPIQGPGRDRSMVFQAASLLPWRTVRQNVTYGLEQLGVGREERNATAARLIEMVGLGGRADAYPGQLSGGMQQRVNLARALAVNPEILLLDEPFAALDAMTRELMQAEFLQIWRETNMTAVFVTHGIDEACYLADRVFVMSRHPGRLKEILPVDLERPRSLDIKRSPEFNELVARVWRSIYEEM